MEPTSGLTWNNAATEGQERRLVEEVMALVDELGSLPQLSELRCLVDARGVLTDDRNDYRLRPLENLENCVAIRPTWFPDVYGYEGEPLLVASPVGVNVVAVAGSSRDWEGDTNWSWDLVPRRAASREEMASVIRHHRLESSSIVSLIEQLKR